MLIDRVEIAKRHAEEAIVKSIELMGLKNPESIVQVEPGIYSHTNTRGRTRYFVGLYGWNKYNSWRNKYNIKHKYHRVNGFFIVEMDSILGLKKRFELGEKFTIKGSTCYGFPTKYKMLRSWNIDDAINTTDKWHGEKLLNMTLEDLEEFKSDLREYIPNDLEIRNKTNCIFNLSGLGIIYIYLMPGLEFTIEKITESEYETCYSILANGEVIERLSRYDIERMIQS